MDARETLARLLARSEMEIHSEDVWDEAGEEMHTAYLAAADEHIEMLGQGGLVLIPCALLEQVLEALLLQPTVGPDKWSHQDSRKRSAARIALRQALEVKP